MCLEFGAQVVKFVVPLQACRVTEGNTTMLTQWSHFKECLKVVRYLPR